MLERIEHDGSREAYVLAGMVFSSTVLSRLAALPERHWSSKASGYISDLCCRCWERGGKAPKDGFHSVLRSWASKKDAKVAADVASTWERVRPLGADCINAGHCIDEAFELFNDNRIGQAMEKADGFRRLGKTKDAMAVLAGLNEMEAGTSTFLRILTDPSIADIMFADKPEPMVKHEGAIGRFYGHLLRRGSFVAYIAAEGVGKSQFLWDLAYRSVMQRLRVAYFQVGDMEQEEVLYRMASRFVKRPWYSTREENPRWPCDVDWPTKLDKHGAESKTLWFDKPMVKADVTKFQKDVLAQLRTDKDYLILSVHPNDTISVQGIKDKLREMDRARFIADVVILDYADNLLPPPGMQRAEPREQMNRIWSQLRGLSMERKCLLATATQCRRLRGKENDDPRFVLLPEHISEEKRKIASVTAMFGINQTTDEQAQGIYRLNKLKARNMHFNKRRCCHVASCLAVSDPAVLSWYPEYVPEKD